MDGCLVESVHGCSKVSTGCKNCYAETLSLRYGQTTAPWTIRNAEQNVMLKPHKLREPLSRAKPWDKPCRVFVNSMSGAGFTAYVSGAHEAARAHARVAWWLWARSVHYAAIYVDAVASEHAAADEILDRMSGLPEHRGGLDLTDIDWLIVGGESGPHARLMDLKWVRVLRDAARMGEVAFFVKQLSGARPGTRLEDLPEDLRIREMPDA